MRVMDLQEIKTLKTERYQLQKVKAYLTGENERVCVLYGLRRTGKTTIIAQAIRWLLDVQGVAPDKILYLEADSDGFDTMDIVYRIIDESKAQYIFIDEVAYISDFIQHSAELYDVYSRSYQRRVVIAGTNLASIFVASLDTLFDRTLRVDVHHLTFYEHCRFKGITNPDWSEFLKYLRTGGLFSPMDEYGDCARYLETSIVDRLDETLSNPAYRSGRSWIDTTKFEYTSWTGIINSICLCSSGNIDYSILQRARNLKEDIRHLQLAGVAVSEAVIAEVREYFDLVDASWNLSKNEVTALIGFLIDCGVIVTLPNIAQEPSKGDRNKYYVSFPFMRYAFVSKFLQICDIAEDVKASSLLGALLEGCAVSEYRIAFPTDPIHFWREVIIDADGQQRQEECDLVVTDATDLLPTGKKRAAIEIKLGHQPRYSGIHYLLQQHPEYGITQEVAKKLEGIQVMQWVYDLGALAYNDGETSEF